MNTGGIRPRGGKGEEPLRLTRDYLVGLAEVVREPAVRSLLGIAGVLVAVGTIVYALVERWSLLDAFYFSVVTLATVGYGDFAPRTAAGKLFTVAYIVVGVSTLAAILGAVVKGAARRTLDSHTRVALVRDGILPDNAEPPREPAPPDQESGS